MSTALAHTPDSAVKVSLPQLILLNEAAGGLKLHHHSIRAVRSGNFLSRFKGRGMEFDETRLYTPGDDARNLDWRVTARTGKTHTKLFREERERPVFLSVDARAPMFFATRGVFKFVLAAKLAALLAWSAQQNGDRVGGQVFSEAAGLELKPEHGRRAVLHFFQALVNAESKRGLLPGQGLDEALARLVHHARPGSLVWILSDFRGLSAAGKFSLMRLRRHCDVALVFLHDPLENWLPKKGRFRFAHEGNEVMLDASDLAASTHAHRFERRREEVQTLARQQGLRFLSLQTTDDPVSTLRSHLRHPIALKHGI